MNSKSDYFFLRYLLLVFLLHLPSTVCAQSDILDTTPTPDIAAPPLPAPSDGQAPGLVINQSNAAEYKSLIIPELYGNVKSHQISFDAASHLKANLDIFKLKAAANAGAELLQASGLLKEGIKLESGLVFPDWRSESDPDKRARQILWNIQSTYWSTKLDSAGFDLAWLESGRVTKKVQGNWIIVFPAIIGAADKSIQVFREKITLNNPAFLKGFNWLTFRFLGIEEDMFWHTSAVLSKVRQLTGSNRTDSILNSAVSPDDFRAWSGKVESVRPIIDKESEWLVPFSDLDYKTLKPSGKACWIVAESQTAPKVSLKWNYESQRFPDGFDWLPTSAVFVPRKLLRVELVPLDPFSLYGRQIIYVDAELMIPYYKFVFNRSGYLWKSVIAVYAAAKSADNAKAYLYNDYLIVDDRQKKMTNLVNFNSSTTCDEFPETMKLEDFDPQMLLAKAETVIGTKK